MDLSKLRRRGLLASVGAAVGLAGCNERDGDSSPAVTGSATDTTTATGTTMETVQGDVPAHDHSGPERGGGSLDADAVTADEVEAGALAADALTAGRLNAANATVGEGEFGDRPLVSTERRVLSVPDDYDTIQAAIDDVPLVLRHEYVVAVADGTYDEHLSVPPVIAGHPKERSDQERSGLEIYGNSENPERVVANSLTISGCTGAVNPYVSGFTFRRANPYDDEDVAVIAYGTTETTVANLRIRADRSTPLRAGIKAYGGTSMKVQEVDFGDGQCRRGLATKHMGEIFHKEGLVEGRLLEHVFFPVAGTIHFTGDNVTATGEQGLNRAADAAFSFDRSSRLLHGVDGFAE